MKKIANLKILHRFGINGIVLWPFVLYADEYPSLRILNHERIHCDQIGRDGVLCFYGNYLREYFIGRFKGLSHDEAYRGISYEREAYDHDRDALYAVSRKKEVPG